LVATLCCLFRKLYCPPHPSLYLPRHLLLGGCHLISAYLVGGEFVTGIERMMA
jgi:hypothetical protein